MSITQYDFWLGVGFMHSIPSMFGKFPVHALEVGNVEVDMSSARMSLTLNELK
jgi:hypothetical protein